MKQAGHYTSTHPISELINFHVYYDIRVYVTVNLAMPCAETINDTYNKLSRYKF